MRGPLSKKKGPLGKKKRYKYIGSILIENCPFIYGNMYYYYYRLVNNIVILIKIVFNIPGYVIFIIF